MARRWLQERKKDYYYRLAKKEEYRSRAAYKLKFINERFSLIRKGDTVIDLGAAPGGWSQVAKEFVGQDGLVIGIDLQKIEPADGIVFLRGDIRKEETVLAIIEVARQSSANEGRGRGRAGRSDEIDTMASRHAGGKIERADGERDVEEMVHCGERVADVIISDMSPRISGNYSLDHAKSVELAGCALSFAVRVLKPNGRFVVKVFQGDMYDDFLAEVRKRFGVCRAFKSKASRKESSEIYVIGKHMAT